MQAENIKTLPALTRGRRFKMKVSRFTTEIDIDENTYMLYNTASRQYYLYERENRENIRLLLKNINAGKYEEHELKQVSEFIRKKIVVADEVDELVELECQENTVRYQNNVFHIMIIVTNGCNFRCSYCVQEHLNKVMDDVSEEKIVRFLEYISQEIKKIRISWFGGEPLLQFDRIERMIQRIEGTCDLNGCILENCMVTNGYSLNDDIIKRICKLNFSYIQFTVDGDKNSHDKRRFLANGKGTYDVVIKNINNVLQAGIPIVLRINIDKENIGTAENILLEFPVHYRKLITVSVSNLYQESNKISVFHIYRKAIELGYQYAGRNNSFTVCNVCYKNGVVVDTEANIIVCANAMNERPLGYIDKVGKIHIKNNAKFCKLKTVSAIKNPECRNCLELPFCIGTCKYTRVQNNIKCIGKRADGLNIEETAKLDYLYDEKIKKENRKSGK